MVNEEFQIACKEVIEILKYLPAKDYLKIPKEQIQAYSKMASREYVFKYNPNLTLDEQSVSKRAKAIIGIIYRDYLASEEHRNKILHKQAVKREENAEIARKNYENSVFAKKDNVEINIDQKLILTEKKWYRKIINKIRSLFQKKT